VLHQTQTLSQTIISTGGGTPCYSDNMKFIHENGISIYLKLSPVSLAHRLSHSKKKRPLIHEKNAGELLDFVQTHLSIREKFYCQADIIVKGENLDINHLSNMINQKIKNKNL
jgi:shikimate kinase